jgi:hypothetical protein
LVWVLPLPNAIGVVEELAAKAVGSSVCNLLAVCNMHHLEVVRPACRATSAARCSRVQGSGFRV